MNLNDPKPNQTGLSRRRFLSGSAAVAASLNIIPSRLLGQNAPSNQLNIAFIGAGGRGAANIDGCASAGQIIQSLADCDLIRVKAPREKYKDAKFYTDWRELLEAEGDKIDAVVVSTPDHTHAVAAMAAMKLNKHVYIEKPLTLTISEARALHAEANKRKLCTQMGNTGHAAEGARLTNEYIQSGSLGDIAQVHCRTNRPIWPQDLVRPAAEEVPQHLNWDLWIGPAKMKPYSSQIAPFKWRGFLDYGTGALGDMGAHIIDHPVWALDLGLPEKIVVEKADRKTPGSEKDSHPKSCIIHLYFAAKGNRGPVHLTWFDGQYTIPSVDGMAEGQKTPDNGCLYHGSKFTMMHNSHGGAPEIIGTNRDKFVGPPKTLERSPGHYKEWINAIKAGDPALAKSNFDVAVPLTEILLLGVIGSLLGPGTEFAWNAEKMTTGNAEADKWIHHDYREGWSL